MQHETVIVLDFGGQYNQLIARRVREANVYSLVLPYTVSLDRIKSLHPKGIILTGGPASVYAEGAPLVSREFFELGIPILGICYGNQLITYVLGGEIISPDKREYGHANITFKKNPLFKGIPSETSCWMSHTDQVQQPALGFKIIGSTKTCTVAAIADDDRKIYGVQFHPEVKHTPQGQQILVNFLYNICECKGDWTMANFAEESIKSIKKKVGDKKVLLALSGGVDSSVAAVMLSKAIGKNLTCIFVDHGLMRKDEGDQVESIFTNQFDLNFVRVNAQERFIGKLTGVSDPEIKRKIIGEEFIRVFEEGKLQRAYWI